MSDAQTESKRTTNPSADKRQVSVLFTDMVGYTAIVDELGEDEALSFTQAIYKQMTDTVKDYGGTVRGFAGDSIMALFGIPDAQEDAALRACRASLALQKTFSEAADTFEKRFNVRPNMRVGVSSGMAVMAAVEGENSPITAVGSTVNLASRIQSLAPEGGCLICDSTRRLVQWVVDINFDGERAIKGLNAPQKLWRLEAVHSAAGRFDASLAHGLSHFVGRDAEMKTLNEALEGSKSASQWADIVAEPGMGKTRLIFEFLKVADAKGVQLIRGHCLADGRQTPFLPFIEIVRRTLDLREGHTRSETVAGLTTGLEKWDLDDPENISLMLNLLGRKPLKNGLEGLDGVLIGLRTRDLILSLIRNWAKAKALVLLIEDIHWIDEASEALLKMLTLPESKINMLIINTRRPYYAPTWLSQETITTIALKPLDDSAIVKVACSWLRVKALPPALESRLIERAGGNPLFGEEMLNFLLEEGAIHVDQGQTHFTDAAAFDELPASMQSLIAARLEQLQHNDLVVLQAASAIGRRFDPALLELVVGDADGIGEALRRLSGQDFVHRDTNASDYIFRHSLVRETLYQAMVSDRLADLHLAIANAIKQRHSDKLSEVADKLAYHYSKTTHTDQAFEFSALAGAKSLGIFSLADAHRYFDTAFNLYFSDPDCAEAEEFASFAANYALCSNLSLKVETLIERAKVIQPVLDQVGNTQHHALFLHHFIYCLINNGRYREALEMRYRLSEMADQMDDSTAKAYALVSELSVSNFIQPFSNADYKERVEKAENLLAGMDDPYLQNFYLAQILWQQISRGHVTTANQEADRLVALGKSGNDPRALGYGLAMKSLIAMLGGNYEQALTLSEEAIIASRTEFDVMSAKSSKISALIALDSAGAMDLADAYIDHCKSQGLALYRAGPEAMYATGLVMRGDIREGIDKLQHAIQEREQEGYEPAANWSRLYLCEIYLAIITGEGEASFTTLARNTKTLLPILLNGKKRIETLVDKIRNCPQFDRDGHHIAHCELILGLLYKAKKKPAVARSHLEKAHKIIKQVGLSPMLSRIDTAISEVTSA